MRLKTFLALLMLCVATAHAATTRTATDTSYAAVSAAVAAASDGDTVVIPAGTSTWTSTLTINKSITLKGQGTNSTKIISAVDVLRLSPTSATLPMRVTGIYFDLGAYVGNSDHAGIFMSRQINNLRIDHCFFRGGNRVINPYFVKVNGVIDHCTFLNGFVMVMLWPGDNTADEPIVPGTTNTVVVEDCRLIRDAQASFYMSWADGMLYGQNGARCTFRNNFCDSSGYRGATDFEGIDAHGSAGWGRGTIIYELYGNTFKYDCSSWDRLMFLRGGVMLVWSNAFVNPSEDPSSGTSFNLTDEWKNRGGSTCGTTDLISDSFFWNNKVNGTKNVTVSVDAAGSGCVVPNRDFFVRPPTNSTDRWYGYRPLVYPHPRVAAEDGGQTNSPPPLPPTNLRVGG